MNMKKKLIFLCLLVMAMVMVLAGCGDPNPYEVNDEMNHNVSIKFDANGGSFTGVNSDSPVVVDSFDISGLQANADGKVELPLLTPDDENRGADARVAEKPGYFLVGWYQERTESTDANGNTVYTYAKPWDFENGRVSVDPNAEHTSKKPVLTLYAAWAPLFEIEYYALDSDAPYETVSIDPNQGIEFTLPAWNEETGAMNMNSIPVREGYTFTAAYFDKEKTQPVDAAAFTHTGVVNKDDATVTGGKMTIYLDWQVGEWFKITTADQFIKNFKPSGCYEILADLDFTDKNWPSALMYGNYTGTIQGNGHAIRNVEIRQTSNNKLNAGLFGSLAEGACLKNITFDNILFAVEKGNLKQGAAYGLLAGSISEDAVLENVAILGSTMEIHGGASLDSVSLGAISGYGNMGLDPSGITCKAVSKNGEISSVIYADALGYITVEFDLNGNPVTDQEQTPEEPIEETPEEPTEEIPEEPQE